MPRRALTRMYWIVAAGSLAAALALSAWCGPVEPAAGSAHRILCLHLPAAIVMYAACVLVFVAGLGFLWQRRVWWDDLAAAAGELVVLYCSVALLTGMVWARDAWGCWWTWSPRLTFSLVLFLLYSGYLCTRRSIRSAPKRAMVCAIYGVVAFLEVPLVYLSVRLLPDIHPSRATSLEPSMRFTLLFWFVPMCMLGAGLVHAKFRLNQKRRSPEPDNPPGSGTPRATVLAGARR